MANLIASIIYVVMQFFPVPDWVIIAGHMGWQLGHGNKILKNLLKKKDKFRMSRHNLHNDESDYQV